MEQTPGDRRLATRARHLTSPRSESSGGGGPSISPSATSTDSVRSGDSVFNHVARAPEDPILGVTIAYNKDPSPVKLNLGVGAYRTEEGKPLVLNVGKKAEQQLVNDRSKVKEYLPIVGLTEFNKLSAKLIFVLGLLKDLGSATSGTIVLLHAFAHNPTGVDPRLQQWEQIRQLMRSKRLMPVFDSAYQGFSSGNLDADAQSVRIFVADGGECVVAQSYAKNMGLYGERVGALSIVCKSSDVASRVESQLKVVTRPMYSSPPIHGASIVAYILRDRQLYNDWTVKLKAMADHIIRMSHQLYSALLERGTLGDWSHRIKQIGIFTLTGLNLKQVVFMTAEYHIYMTSEGRISMAGLSSATVPHLADAIHASVTCIFLTYLSRSEPLPSSPITVC